MSNVVEYLESHAGLASWGLLLTAVLTAIFAWSQLSQGRELRFQQARPYVVVGLRRVASPGVVELYVKNFGLTAAENVTLSSDPGLESLTHREWFQLFGTLPTLAPGEEWSTIWETYASKRSGQGSFTNRYKVTLSYLGHDGRKPRDLESTFVLDWQPFLASTHMETYTIHHVAKDLHEIQKSLGASHSRNLVNAIRGLVQPRETPEPKPDSRPSAPIGENANAPIMGPLRSLLKRLRPRHESHGKHRNRK